MHIQLFFIATILASFHVAASTDRCLIELTRLFGIGPRNSYALICKCDPVVAKSIVFTSAPRKMLDTVGRSQATVNCIEEKQRRLTTMCNHLNHTEFNRRAQPMLNQCVNTTVLTEKEKQLTEPFTFVKDNCTSKFAWATNPEQTAAWVCECPQSDLFEVTPGWSRYVITGNDSEVDEDFEQIRSCALESAEQMQNICSNTPGDYDVLALQNLQTCCKRARVDSESKFDCAAVVPDDLSETKFEL